MPTPENICGIVTMPDPADRHVGEHRDPARRIEPDEVEHEAERGAEPDGGEHDPGDRAVEREQGERRVRARDEEEDRRVVEPSRPDAPRGRLERVAVVERAGAEHRRERRDVDPGGEPWQRSVGEGHERDARDKGNEEGPEVEHTAQARLHHDGHVLHSAWRRDGLPDRRPGTERSHFEQTSGE